MFKPNKKGEDHPRERQVVCLRANAPLLPASCHTEHEFLQDDPGPTRRPRAFTNISQERPGHVQKVSHSTNLPGLPTHCDAEHGFQQGDFGSSRRERLSTEESEERLRQIQMVRLRSNFILILAHCNAKHGVLQDDLGSARRERVSTEDDPRNNPNVRLEDLEARRQSNIPGTEMFKRANKERSALAAWASKSSTMEAFS